MARDQDTHDPGVDPDDTLLGRWRGQPGIGELPDGTLDVEDDGWIPTPEELAQFGDDADVCDNGEEIGDDASNHHDIGFHAAHPPWNEQQHPRVPKGQHGGGEFTTGSGAPSSSLEQQGKILNQLNKPLKGGSAERVALRALLKTTDNPAWRKKIKDRIAESFKKQIEALQQGKKLGDLAKAADLQKKLQKMGGEYGQAPLTPGPKSELPSMSTPGMYAEYGQAASKVVPAPSNPAHPAFKYDLAPHERKSITGYTGSHYVSLNAALRDGRLTDQQYQHVGWIHDALDKLPVFKGTVYRGVTGDYSSKYIPGKIIEERGFTSTSRSSNKTMGYGTLYEIQSLNGRDVKSVSLHPHENEVLFKSGTRFRVTKVSGNHVYMEEVGRFR